ncbi:hypothetical protein [Hufsiella ginkgonis]|uniref:Uncharacterized protein n=1 Tax=Hufsiella ginkgonis TaxID=2695274 RepID=A0A7K1XX39_9SPHI|nr:hypothetical protein [Hufsiella ginkgonis]MXV15574.1 hypothetical protein [Hufsiella ginkgonis]
MKKHALALCIVMGFALVSCKKEETAQPVLKIKKVADIRDIGTWDGRSDSLSNP